MTNPLAKTLFRACLAASLVLLAWACAGRQPHARTDQAPNLSRAKRQTAAYYESGEHARDLKRAAGTIDAYIAARLETPVQGRPAVVFDLDETLVDNYEALREDGFRYHGPGSGQWLALLRAADPKPVGPMRDLYSGLRGSRVALFIVSERPQSMRGATAKTLFEDGFGGWTGLYLTRPLAGENEAQAKARVRKMLQDQGYAIIANISDQEADLSGGHAEKHFKLPNRLYAYE